MHGRRRDQGPQLPMRLAKELGLPVPASEPARGRGAGLSRGRGLGRGRGGRGGAGTGTVQSKTPAAEVCATMQAHT